MRVGDRYGFSESIMALSSYGVQLIKWARKTLRTTPGVGRGETRIRGMVREGSVELGMERRNLGL